MLIFINKLTHVSTCYQAAGRNIDVVSDIGDLISFCLNALLTFFFFFGQTNILFQLNRKENNLSSFHYTT